MLQDVSPGKGHGHFGIISWLFLITHTHDGWKTGRIRFTPKGIENRAFSKSSLLHVTAYDIIHNICLPLLVAFTYSTLVSAPPKPSLGLI